MSELAAELRDELLNGERWIEGDAPPTLALSDLAHDRRVLAALYQGTYRYPAFQFMADGQVSPYMADVLRFLPNDNYGWASMFWFFQPSGHLDGQRPADVFASDPVLVVKAAERDFVRRDDEF